MKRHYKLYISDFIAWGMLCLLIAMLTNCSPASGGEVCRGGVCKQRVVAHQVAYQAFPKVYYAVAANLQQQAVETHQFRASDEYGEYLELKAWRAGFEAARQPTNNYQKQEELTAPEEIPPQDQQPEPPQPSPELSFSGRYPAIETHCMRCHTGDNPKGGVWLDGSVDLSGPEAAEKRDTIMAQVWNGHMPKGKTLDDEALSDIVEELYGEK
jgi:hypothetical protein